MPLAPPGRVKPLARAPQRLVAGGAVISPKARRMGNNPPKCRVDSGVAIIGRRQWVGPDWMGLDLALRVGLGRCPRPQSIFGNVKARTAELRVSERLRCLQHRLDMAGHADLAPGLGDLALAVDQEGGAFDAHIGFAIHAFFDPNPKAICGDLLRV